MPIISVRDNENSRWKRNTKKQNKAKTKKKTIRKKTAEKNKEGGLEAVVKEWELNDFIVHLS